MSDNTPVAPLTNADYIKKYAPLVEAWGKFGFMDGKAWGPTANIGSDMLKATIAVTLENTRKAMLPNSTVSNPQTDAVTVAESHRRNIEQAMKISERQAQEQGTLYVANGLNEATSPVDTTSMSGATNLPMILGYIRKIMPKMNVLQYVSVQPMSLPTGRVFFLDRVRHNNGANAGSIENRAGWSYRSFDATPGENTTITKTAKFTLASEDVTATNHKYLTEIGVEIEQDLRAYHGIDGAALINEAATDEMALELQEVILHEMWSRAGGGIFQIGAKPSAFTQSEWDRRYMEVIQRANESIWTNQRVNAAHLVFGSDWSVQFGNINNTYTPAPVGDFEQAAATAENNMRRLGDYLVMRASLPFPTNDALLIHKGTSWIDASYFYLPYIPFQPYSVFRDPTTQTVKMSWLSRYSTFMVGTNFRGDKRIAILRQSPSTITGTSYPGYVEFA